MGGGRGIKTPFGIFFGSNITPHPEEGVGRWSDEDFIRAMTLGMAPDGRHYFPRFPLYFLQTDEQGGPAPSQGLPL